MTTSTFPEPQWRTVYAIWVGAPVFKNGPRAWTPAGNLPDEGMAQRAACDVAQAMRFEKDVQVFVQPMRTCLPETKPGRRR